MKNKASRGLAISALVLSGVTLLGGILARFAGRIDLRLLQPERFERIRGFDHVAYFGAWPHGAVLAAFSFLAGVALIGVVIALAIVVLRERPQPAGGAPAANEPPTANDAAPGNAREQDSTTDDRRESE